MLLAELVNSKVTLNGSTERDSFLMVLLQAKWCVRCELCDRLQLPPFGRWSHSREGFGEKKEIPLAQHVQIPRLFGLLPLATIYNPFLFRRMDSGIYLRFPSLPVYGEDSVSAILCFLRSHFEKTLFLANTKSSKIWD